MATDKFLRVCFISTSPRKDEVMHDLLHLLWMVPPGHKFEIDPKKADLVVLKAEDYLGLHEYYNENKTFVVVKTSNCSEPRLPDNVHTVDVGMNPRAVVMDIML